MLVIILMLTLSLYVFIFLNACGLYNACMSYVKGVYRLVTKSDKSLGNRKVVLQFGIRAKVSTLSLDGPVEQYLDSECEGKLSQEDQFWTLFCSEASRRYLMSF